MQIILNQIPREIRMIGEIGFQLTTEIFADFRTTSTVKPLLPSAVSWNNESLSTSLEWLSLADNASNNSVSILS